MKHSPRKTLTWLAALCIPLAVLGSEAASWWWMHPEPTSENIAVLDYQFPHERPNHTLNPPKAGIIGVLKCDKAQAGDIEDDRGRRVQVSFLEWNGTDETGLMQAFGHSPDVCMGVAGFEVEEFLPSRRFQLGEHELIFDVTLFRDPFGDPLYIYKVPWTEGSWGLNLLREGPTGKEFRQFKFKAVGKRWKPHYARVLMGGVTGCHHEQESWDLFMELVLQDLTMTPAPAHR